MDRIDYLPQELKEAARKLPPEQQHTVLDLPPPGQGHNVGLYGVAIICYRMKVSYDDTLAHLESIYHVDRVDHRTAPGRAVDTVWRHKGNPPNTSVDDIPDPQEDLLLRYRRTPASELKDASPHTTMVRTHGIIRNLFKAGDIINYQVTAVEFGTLAKLKDIPPKEEIEAFKFLNPSTFKKVEGVEVDPGKISTRCNANVKSRPYMLIEMDSSDEAMVERFTTLATVMAKYAPLKLVVDTGNKSNHFWFEICGISPKITKEFFKIMCAHGADKRMAVKSQIARMPNTGAAEEGRGVQRVLYFDPKGKKYPKKIWDLAGFEADIKQTRHLEYYYHGPSGKYYRQDNANSWFALGRQSLATHLALAGFRSNKMDGELCSPAETITASLEIDKSVELIMHGASGRHAGYYEENGNKFLVLKSPRLLKAREGKWGTIKKFLRGFVKTDIQYEILMGWLSSGARDFRNNGSRVSKFTPAQMVNFGGPRNCGKTLFLETILPSVFGGRLADGSSLFALNKRQFNSDIFSSELVFLDDTDVLGISHKDRTIFGERIKDCTVGAGGSYEHKYGDMVQIKPWWRLVRFHNLEPHVIATMPPMEEGIRDKIILLLTHPLNENELDTTSPGWAVKLKKAFAEELPAFLHYLLKAHEIKEEHKDPEQRYAVASYANPDILALIDEGSPESYLLHKLATSRKLFATTGDFLGGVQEADPNWQGTSNQLYEILAEDGTQNAQTRFRKICPTPNVLLAQLKILEEKFPDKVWYSRRSDKGPKKLKGSFYWTVAAPADESPEELDVESML